MKKFALFFIFVISLSWPAMAQDVATPPDSATSESDLSHAAVKSFCAWYIKNGTAYEGFDSAWQGWLDDPEVPEKFKAAGQGVRENIKNDLESLKTGAEDLRDETVNRFMELAKELKKSFQQTREAAENKWESFLNQAITGKTGNE